MDKTFIGVSGGKGFIFSDKYLQGSEVMFLYGSITGSKICASKEILNEESSLLKYSCSTSS